MMPSFIPLDDRINSILKIMKKELARHQTTTSTHPKCGEEISQKHFRFIIAHARPDMIYRWIQHIFGNFIQFEVQKIVLVEELIGGSENDFFCVNNSCNKIP
jgi:hypothetical protein